MPATPAISTGFGDLIDPRFQKIWNDSLKQLPDQVPLFFGMPPDNGRADMRWSGIGAFGDFVAFTGTVNYDSVAQGYDTTATHVEFTSGFQVERKLFDDDQYHVMDAKPTGLARAAVRSRNKHALRPFNNAFSNDTYFGNNSEGVALCSNSHTTTASGVSTASGFDNLITSSLTATAVAAARIQMVGYVDDRGNIFDSNPDCLLYPPNLYGEAFEIVESMGKPDTGNNNKNVHQGQYDLMENRYLTDTNNWFMLDKTLMKEFLLWVDRVPLEFAYIEDFDTLVAKWRAYMRYSQAWINWRWILGAQVS
jgi:phage major head subunit gpT-like protein